MRGVEWVKKLLSPRAPSGIIQAQSSNSATGEFGATSNGHFSKDPSHLDDDDATAEHATGSVSHLDESRERIMQVSDVHFGSTFDVSVWEYVKGLARREKPNIIVCTGDIVDHGGLFMLALGRQELEKLRQDSGVNAKLRTVPGNHDCGPWGLFKFPPFSWNYRLVFGSNPIPTKWFVSYGRYRTWAAPLRLLFRLALTPALYVLAMVLLLWGFLSRNSRLKLEQIRRDDADMDIVLIHLDSNDRLWLASGNVDVQEVTRLKAEMLNMRDSAGAKSFAPRIALIHHHPLPIPDARITEGLTSFEPFLVLRNAGILLRELNRCDVDLILHGHKHYTSFARLGYSLDHQTEGEIAVLAAGSAGITHAEQGRNSVNFIDVFKSGRMAYTTIFFGAGAGDPVTELFRKSNFVHGMEMHKMRMHRRAAERQGQWVKELRHEVRVDEDGDVVIRHSVASHHVERDLKRTSVPVRIAVSMGRVAHNTLELSEESLRAGHKWHKRPSKPDRDIECFIDLGQYLAPSSTPSSYGYSYVGFNTYATSEWETLRSCERQERVGPKTGRAAGMEFTAAVVRVPVRQLVLSLQLAEVFTSPEPQVRVMRWRTYPDVPLDDSRQFDENEEDGWLYDADATLHESGRLARVGETWQLSVSNPLVGHRYEIRWRVRDPGALEARALGEEYVVQREAEETRRRGRAELYRSLLLNLSNDREREEGISKFLGAYLEYLCKPSFQVEGHDLGEDMEVAMFAYDSNGQEHRLVAGTAGSVSPADALTVPLNEGIVGAAFKRASPAYYVDPELSGSRKYAAYLFDKHVGRQTKWRYVVALPIFASSAPFPIEQAAAAWSSASCVGVMTIASTSPASGLFALAEGIARGALTQEVLRAVVKEQPAAAAGEGIAPEESDETPPEPGEEGGVELDYARFWAYAHMLVDVLEVPALYGEPEYSDQVGDSAGDVQGAGCEHSGSDACKATDESDYAFDGNEPGTGTPQAPRLADGGLSDFSDGDEPRS